MCPDKLEAEHAHCIVMEPHVQLIWPLALLSRHLKIKLMASGLNEGPEVDMHMSPKGRASDQPGVAGRDVM